MIDKGVCYKGFLWNPSNCECECYKSCNFSEYLDYKNCKCKKRLADKLAEECTKNIDETKLVEITSFKIENNPKCSSCTLCIVLFSISFTVNNYFLCAYWYLKKMLFVLLLVAALKQQFYKVINGKSQTNRDQKSDLLFLQRHGQSQKCSNQTS